MERALVRLIGAGLTSVMPGFGVAVPTGAIEGGYALIDVLSRSEVPVAVGLLDRLVQALWLQWQRSGLPRDVADAHMTALPSIMDRNRPPATLVRDALLAAQGSASRPTGNPVSAREIAAETIALTRQSGDIARAGLDETIAFMLLDQLYAAIIAEVTGVDVIRPFCASYLQQGGWLAPVPTPPSPGPQPQSTTGPPPLPQPVLSQPTPRQPIIARLTLGAVASLRASVEMRRKVFPDIEAAANALADRTTKLIDRVAADAERSVDVRAELTEAAMCIANGSFVESDRALAAAEHQLIQLAQTNLRFARDRMHAAAAVLEYRGDLEAIRFDFRKAARHYRSAMRCFTKTDAARQWQYLMRQAQVLLSQDEINGDQTALTDAAKVCAEAGRMRPEEVGALVWAEGEVRLATFLIALGQREKSHHRFAEAIGHALAACGVFAVERSGTGWLQSQMTLARALWLQGDLVGNQNMLGDAAAACRTALDLLVREEAPQDWAAATEMLGQILLRQAMVTGSSAQFAEAVDQLRGVLRLAETAKLALNTSQIEACLGRALQGQFTVSDQPFLLDLAATAFRRAIKAAHAKDNLTEQAGLQHELGMTLWLMAERTADRISHEAAIETLERSAASFQRLGNVLRTAEVRADIARLTQTGVSK